MNQTTAPMVNNFWMSGKRVLSLVLFMGMACFVLPARAQAPSTEQRITLTYVRTDLATLLQEIDRQSDFSFSYDKSVVEKVRVDSIFWKAVPLREVLAELGRRTGLQ